MIPALFALLVAAAPALKTQADSDEEKNLELMRTQAAARAKAKMLEAANALLDAAHEARLGAEAELNKVSVRFKKTKKKVTAKAQLALDDLADQIAKARKEDLPQLEKKLREAFKEKK